jgi:hypothetical protein
MWQRALAGLLSLVTGASAQETVEDATASLSQAIGASLRRAEYRCSPKAPGIYGAPNGAQDLRSRGSAGFSWASSETPMAFLEWEVEPLRVTFYGVGIERSAGQSLTPAGGTLTFNEPAAAFLSSPKLRFALARSFHWRARIATDNPLFPHTAWFGIPGNNLSEAKLRQTRSSVP